MPLETVDEVGPAGGRLTGLDVGANRVGQPATNSVRISSKWVERSLLHAVDERVRLGFSQAL
jgi:hypothetical protein